MIGRTLRGRRIVILEDDYFQAHDCKAMLEQAGAVVVAVSATIPSLDDLLAKGPIDAVLIDINLGDSVSFDFARLLVRNAIPFAFLTGYDAAMLPDDLAGRAYISKPADHARVRAVLAEIIASRPD